MPWTDYASAPAPGTPLGQCADLRGAVALLIETENGRFPLLVVETAQGPRAYVNACPHQFLPLDYRSDQLLSADGTQLMCSGHGALFDASTGQGTGGNGLGCALDPVPLRVSDGMLVIG